MLGIFLDTETSGLDPRKDSPLEIAFQVIDLTTGRVLGSFESVIKLDKTSWDKRDLTSIQINEFTWDEVKKGKKIDWVRDQIISLFNEFGIKRGEAVFICQNPSFDRGFFNHIIPVSVQEALFWPYHWLDLASMYWAKRVIEGQAKGSAAPLKVALSKNEIAKYYKLPPENTPHRAMNGVEHLIACYCKLMKLRVE